MMSVVWRCCVVMSVVVVMLCGVASSSTIGCASCSLPHRTPEWRGPVLPRPRPRPRHPQGADVLRPPEAEAAAAPAHQRPPQGGLPEGQARTRAAPAEQLGLPQRTRPRGVWVRAELQDSFIIMTFVLYYFSHIHSPATLLGTPVERLVNANTVSNQPVACQQLNACRVQPSTSKVYLIKWPVSVCLMMMMKKKKMMMMIHGS